MLTYLTNYVRILPKELVSPGCLPFFFSGGFLVKKGGVSYEEKEIYIKSTGKHN